MKSEKLKKVLFEFLLRDLYPVEIIYYRDSIWFINREQRYWYFEYHKEDKHLWWRWSHFKGAMEMFSMDAEEKQELFGEMINMILSKKQELESKYPKKVFKTIGSVINFKEKVGKNKKFEVEKTLSSGARKTMEAHKILDNKVKTTTDWVSSRSGHVDEVLNNEVETICNHMLGDRPIVDEVLNNEVETTTRSREYSTIPVDKVLNHEVETIKQSTYVMSGLVDEVLNHEVKTTRPSFFDAGVKVDEVLNFEIKTIHSYDSEQNFTINSALNNDTEKIQETDEVLNFDSVLISHGELIEEDKMMEEILSVEINSIRTLKGNVFQDMIVNHIIDETEKRKDNLVIYEDDYVKTYSHDVYMCDHLVQNVLDVGVNSIHYDTHHHQPLVDGILKKA